MHSRLGASGGHAGRVGKELGFRRGCWEVGGVTEGFRRELEGVSEGLGGSWGMGGATEWEEGSEQVGERALDLRGKRMCEGHIREDVGGKKERERVWKGFRGGNV